MHSALSMMCFVLCVVLIGGPVHARRLQASDEDRFGQWLDYYEQTVEPEPEPDPPPRQVRVPGGVARWTFDNPDALARDSVGGRENRLVVRGTLSPGEEEETRFATLEGSAMVAPFPRVVRRRGAVPTTLRCRIRLRALPNVDTTLGELRDQGRPLGVRLRISRRGELRFENVASGRIDAQEWFGGGMDPGTWHEFVFGSERTWKGTVCWAFLDGNLAAEWLGPSTISSQGWTWFSPGVPLDLDDIDILDGARPPPGPELTFVDAPPRWEDDPRLPPSGSVFLYVTFDDTMEPEIGGARLRASPRRFEYVEGVSGKALVMGEGARARLQYALSSMPNTRGAVGMWLKPIGFNPAQSGMRVFTGPAYLGLQVDGRGSGNMSFQHDARQTVPSVGRFRSGPDEWVHVLATWRESTVEVYVNGQRVSREDTRPGDGTGGELWPAKWDGNLVLTLDHSNPVAVDELLVFNNWLAPAEARGVYDRNVAAVPPDVTARNVHFSELAYFPGVEKVRLTVDTAKAGLGVPAELEMLVRSVSGREYADPVRMQVHSVLCSTPYVSLPVPLPPGEYEVEARLKRGDRSVSQTHRFVRRDIGWLDKPLEEPKRALKPWTSVAAQQVKDRKLTARFMAEAWGRDYTFDDLALPMQISVRQTEPTLGAPGEKGTAVGEGGPVVGKRVLPILAGPVKYVLKSKGRELRLRPRSQNVEEEGGYQARMTATAEGGGLSVENEVRLELDGALFYRLTLAPARDGKPVTVDSLEVHIPLRPEVCRFYHADVGGAPEMKGAGRLPDTEGTVWGSRQSYADAAAVPSDARWGTQTSPAWAAAGRGGSFVPYLWIGNEDRGLAWWVYSTRNWLLNSEVDSLELIRKDGRGTLVVRILQKPVDVAEARAVTFVLTPTPVRPLPPDWRHLITTTYTRPSSAVWARGACSVEPDPHWYVRRTEAQPGEGAEAEEADYRYIQYLSMVKLCLADPEVEYFRSSWQPGVEENPLAAQKVSREFVSPRAFSLYLSNDRRAYATANVIPVESQIDYRVSKLDWLVKNCGWQGVYVDDAALTRLYWPVYGFGRPWREGEEAHMDWSTLLWRDFGRRHAGVFEANGQEFPAMVFDAAGGVCVSGGSFATIAAVGEWGDDEGCRDFLEKWNPDVLRARCLGRNTGLVPVFSRSHLVGATASRDKRGELRRAQGSLLLHDIWTLNTRNVMVPGERERSEWAQDGKALQFYPYWTEVPTVKTDHESVLAGAYRTESGEALIAVVNYLDEKRATAIDVPPTWLSNKTVYMASPDEKKPNVYPNAWQSVPLLGREKIVITVPGRDARVLLIK